MIFIESNSGCFHSFYDWLSGFSSGSKSTNLGIISGKVIDQILGREIHWVNLRNVSEGLGIAFSDHNLGALLDKFNTVLELKPYGTFIARAHAGAVLVLDLDCLDCRSDTTNVQDSLVAILYRRVVMEYFDLSVEVFHA